MKLKTTITAAAFAANVGGQLIGDGTIRITGVNEIHHVKAGDLSFVDHPKYYAPALESAASVILIDRAEDCPEGKALIVVEQPFKIYNDLVTAERPVQRPGRTVDPTAVVAEDAYLAPGVVVGPGVTVGAGCHVEANVVLGEGTELGKGVYVGAGSVLGSEAFYFKKTANGFIPWRSGGAVRVEDRAEIGPNCTVARGVSSVTVIGEGSKLDALVQIGHDCKIGKHCIIAAQVGIAGNTTVGDWCIFQGQVGIAQNLTIGDRTIILAKSGVSKDLEGGKQYFGYPAQEARTAFRDLAVLRQLRKK